MKLYTYTDAENPLSASRAERNDYLNGIRDAVKAGSTVSMPGCQEARGQSHGDPAASARCSAQTAVQGQGQCRSQRGGATGVHHAGEFHASPEVLGEIRTPLAVLGFEAEAGRVVQDR